MTMIGQPPQPGNSAIVPAPVVEMTARAAMVDPESRRSRRQRRSSAPLSLSLGEKAIAYIVLSLGSLLFLLPFYFVLNGSIKTEADVGAGRYLTPPTWANAHFDNYEQALGPSKMDFYPALSNTVVIVTCCVIGQVLSCSIVGFGFARFDFRGRSLLFIIMLSTMMLPGQVTMIPIFMIFRSLHMIDTFWPLILPAWFASPFFAFMFRQFFSQIPEELIEAARIDGASNFRIYWQLMLPLSGPVVALVAIYTFLGTWNDFMGPLIYLNSPNQRTLALALAAFGGQYGVSDTNLLMAATVVCMLPCVLLFFAAQKYFVESVAMTGSKA